MKILSDAQCNGEKAKINATEIMQDNELLSDMLNRASAGFHNGIYRGEDITDLFYDGTLSEEIASGTFRNIFIGDYIIGKSSGLKYLVADINYRLHMGGTECVTPHVLMIPDLVMGLEQMNSSASVTGAYIGSEMYTTNLSSYKTIIQNDFGVGHILSHYNQLQNAVTSGYESGGTVYDSTIELMNECMVFGGNMFHNMIHGTNSCQFYEMDSSQLSLFRLDKSHIIAYDEDGTRQAYWLRNVANASSFCDVNNNGNAHYTGASSSRGVRPCFLIY